MTKTATTNYLAGVDAGNSSLKLVMEGCQALKLPSIYSIHTTEKTSAGEFEDISPDQLEENIDVTISSPALTFNNMRYVVGQKVLNDKRKVTEMEKKSDKSTDELPVILTLSGLAVNLMKLDPNSNLINAKIDMALALPVQAITPAKAQANAKRFMGHHTVKFHHPTGREVVVNIELEYVRCLAESQAAAWGLVFNKEGQLQKRKVEVNGEVQEVSLDKRLLLHYGIGGGTTEKAVTQGIMFKPSLSSGLGFGVKETIKDILDGWNLKNPIKTISSTAEFDRIYWDEEHPTNLELKQFAEPYILQLALTFGEDIINRIDEFSKEDPLTFVYGGGSKLIAENLKKVLNMKGRNKNVFFLTKNPIFADAEGLLVYVSSPRFQELKEKEMVGHAQT